MRGDRQLQHPMFFVAHTEERLAFRKGAADAKVAVARKRAIRLFIMVRDQIDYVEFVRRGSHAGMLGDVALA